MLRSSLRTSLPSSKKLASSLVTTRTKVSLPDLRWDFHELEPFISGKINELHYTKHHQTYVNGYNAAIEQLSEAKETNNTPKVIELQQALRFHGGGYVNHNLFWDNLAPPKQGGGELPSESSDFSKKVIEEYGSFDSLISLTNSKLAGIQGSGWAFIVKNKENGSVEVVQRPNQDTVSGSLVPLVAIDAWEHAYYLQYQNVKADYFKAIWNVINWKEAEKRFAK
ncbi:Superoxide dismutase [Mn], mitochondrial [Komagataella phaffii CBS 7435]|uniref:Superoxide dismutase n=2 Tax=Komagataella phaffii TaxID=460519 RepID=C4QXC7_KOMPG|nr:Mitochondrial superoxide dismutase, protects cells against oxygen toxicity [Komagataella phaffii GS115]AOA61769.1 GQ67_02116T0 [Komagataella phaffii]KAI0464723.1 Superoxide dismutase [Mn], mitochondrial [Komagataella kurtzmanii]CAH2446713.1 Superoxide dismutase [Mn], mitochondrial [Komagataella phaffii CBS 7435]AOA65715.1 GQ68_02131T0 [Komagataella phaffii GS115]CAY67900.1 Mitochondrial superoxide dismutase, protects cells against oxygen toxicity [Komagataella phaffii GS115]